LNGGGEMDLRLGGKIAVVTGGGGAICGAIARGLALEGVSVAIWDISLQAAERKAEKINGELRGIGQGLRAQELQSGSSMRSEVCAFECDVLSTVKVKAAVERTIARFGTIDILLNGAGGSRKEATTSEGLSFFDLDPEAMEQVVGLNYMSAVLPSKEVGRVFAEKRSGVILNISSVSGTRPLTRAVSYCSGKAAINNFTQWLAVYMAKEHSPAIRVNAIAPGFVLTEQNRFLLEDPATKGLTERGSAILAHVPMGRLGTPEDIVGAALWLLSDQARFVTGAVIPVDGGFSAQSGV